MNSEVAIKLMKAAKNDDGRRRNYGNWNYYDWIDDDNDYSWRTDDDIDDDDYGNDYNYYKCKQCRKDTTSFCWCQPCNSSNFCREFGNWKSENGDIDTFIKEVQLKAKICNEVLEWIPYSRFKDVTLISKGGFGGVYSAEWRDGYILYWSVRNNKWKRKGTTKVALKCLNESQNISTEFLNEIKNLYKCGEEYSRVTRCYGITRHDETNNFMIVMQLVDYGNIRNNLSRFYEMSWKDKFKSLYGIAKGLHQIHKAKLVHRDFHAGNILLSSINDAIYITDLGLCKPIDEYTNSEAKERKVYGVLPYVAPEVLRKEAYTEAADVYAFGIILSELLSGIPPFNNLPHDNDLSIGICLGLRPEIPKNMPILIVNLMQNCWDAEPSKRLSSRELCNILYFWMKYEPESKLSKKIKESENVELDFPSSSETYKTHPSAIYTSRLLNFGSLPEPVNSKIGSHQLPDIEIPEN